MFSTDNSGPFHPGYSSFRPLFCIFTVCVSIFVPARTMTTQQASPWGASGGELRPEHDASTQTPVPGLGTACTGMDGPSWWFWQQGCCELGWRGCSMCNRGCEDLRMFKYSSSRLVEGGYKLLLCLDVMRMRDCNSSLGQMNPNWSHASGYSGQFLFKFILPGNST